MNTAKQAFAQRPDLVRNRVTHHRSIDLRHHHARSDHAAPASTRCIVRFTEEWIIIATTMGEIADIVCRRCLNILTSLGGLHISEQFFLAINVMVGDLVIDRCLPFFALLNVLFCGFCVCHRSNLSSIDI